ncbi:hypothetical protein FQN49_003238 [Arthroderma sp. PD_2]|nr:hypothetical protein FQN49_003238 [Arthroderma sp. PD_2]
MTMFIERRSSTRAGPQKRVLLSPKGFTQDLFDDMAAYGLFSDADDMSDPDNSVTLTDRHCDSRKVAQTERIRVHISVNQPRLSRKGHSEPDTSIALIEGNPTPVLRRKRAPSPTPSMTSTSSTEETETIRPTRKKVNVMKPAKKFKEVVPVVHIPEVKEKKTFREMSPRRLGDPIVITPKIKAIIPKKVLAPEAKKAITAPPTKEKAKKVRFALASEDKGTSKGSLAGTARRL